MEQFNDIIHDNGLTLVDFYATWCGPCKAMHPVLERLKEQMGDSIRILKLDVDRNGALAAAYGIQSVPTLIRVRRGNVLWRQSGAMDIEDLRQRLQPYL